MVSGVFGKCHTEPQLTLSPYAFLKGRSCLIAETHSERLARYTLCVLLSFAIQSYNEK